MLDTLTTRILCLVFVVLLSGCSSQESTTAITSPSTPAVPRIVWSKLPSEVVAAWGTEDGGTWLVVGDEGLLARKEPGSTNWSLRRLSKDLAIDVASVFSTKDGQHSWLVGDRGEIVHSGDFGVTWARQTVPTDLDLSSIIGSADGSLLLALHDGDERFVLKSTDLGQTWVTLKYDPATLGNDYIIEPHIVSLLAVDGDGQRVFAVADDATGVASHIVESRDAGSTWRPTSISKAVSTNSRAYCSDGPRSRCWLLADDGWILGRTDGTEWTSTKVADSELFSIDGNSDGSSLWIGGADGMVFRSVDYGRTWTKYLPSREIDGRYLWVRSFGTNSVLFGGEEALVASDDGGVSWELKIVGSALGITSAHLPQTSEDHWMAGMNGRVWHKGDGLLWGLHVLDGRWNIARVRPGRLRTDMWAVGVEGHIAGSIDNGRTWTLKTTHSTKEIRDIRYLPDAQRLVAVGFEGEILRSSDAGTSWERVQSPTAVNLYSLHSNESGDRVWATGERGTILRSVDSGSSWTLLETGVQSTLFGMTGAQNSSELIAYGYGGAILRSADGERWSKEDVKTSGTFVDASWNSSGQIIAVTELGEVLWSRMSGDWVRLRRPFRPRDEAPEAWRAISNSLPTIRAATDEGAWMGFVQGAHAELAEFRVSPSGTRIDVAARVRFDPETNVPRALHLYSATEFNARNEVGFAEVPGGQAYPATPGSEDWKFVLDPTLIGARSGDHIRLRATLVSGGGTSTGIGEGDFAITLDYKLPDVVFDRWAWWREHSGLLVGAALLLWWPALLGFLYVAAPASLLRVYEASWLFDISEAGQAKIPAAIVKGLIRTTLLPALVRRPKVLDAWVERNRDSFREHFTTPASRAVEHYVPLPVVIQDAAGSRPVEQPSAAAIRPLLQGRRVVLEIVGQGGIGKTTFARAIAGWTQLSLTEGLAPHPILPVWVDENTADPLQVITGKLRSALGRDTPEALIRALLKEKRLMIVLDGLSERDDETVAHVTTIHRNTPINLIVLTSRKTLAFDGVRTVNIVPQALDEGSLLRFVSNALNLDARAKDFFSTMSSQIDLAHRIARVLESSGAESTGRQITPLVVQLCVRRAIDILSDGRSLADFPESVPAVYLDYVRTVSRNVTGASVDDVMAFAMALASVSVGAAFIPRPVRKSVAIAAGAPRLQEAVARACLESLTSSGVAVERTGLSPESQIGFALDPVCEYFAAMAMAIEAGTDEGRWTALWQRVRSSRAQGFEVALTLVCRAFGPSEDWPRCSLPPDAAA